VVPEYDRLVVFRLGRSIGHKGPGLVWLWPIVDRAVAVDLREQVLEVPHQTTINGQRPHQYRLPRLLADQEISAAPRRAGGDEPPAFGRADAAGDGHVGGRQTPGEHHRG